MQRIILILFLMCQFGFAASKEYNVMDFGAKADGKTLDSPAINAAICQAEKNGGGRVFLPAGKYLCGSIRMKSNIELHLDAGAVIIAAPNEMGAYDQPEEFDFPEYQDGGHTYFHNSLIWGENLENVSITGRGIIRGEHLTRFDTETNGQVYGGSIGKADKAIALKLCRNVVIRDLTILQGGHFAIIVTGCDNVNMDNLLIDTNRDGIDIDCCRFTTVSNCKVNSPRDDAIVLKSSYALKKAVVCDNILITNCVVTGFLDGTMYDRTYRPAINQNNSGRIKLGTESNGGYRNVTISNCTCLHSDGLAFECVDQGVMENIVVSNITMDYVHHYPIFITTGCRNRGPKGISEPSTAQSISISNVVVDHCDDMGGIIITGMKDAPLKNISLSDITIHYEGGGTEADRNIEYPEIGAKYPEPSFNLGRCPAYGLFASYVDGLTIKNVNFKLYSPDSREAMIIENCK